MAATSTSISFKLLQLNEADEQDMALLKKGVDRSKLDPSAVLKALLNGEALLWRGVVEDKRVIVVTQEQIKQEELELYVLLIAGSGALLFREFLQETLEHFGRSRGAVRIRAVQPKAVYRLIGQPLGYKIDDYMISKEL